MRAASKRSSKTARQVRRPNQGTAQIGAELCSNDRFS